MLTCCNAEYREDNNDLTNAIPSEIGRMTNLIELQLGKYSFSVTALNSWNDDSNVVCSIVLAFGLVHTIYYRGKSVQKSNFK